MEGELWGCSPAMALVLRSTAPSGLRDIVDLRNRIEFLMPFCPQPKTGFLERPWVRHVRGEFHEFPSSRIYIGFGHTDCQSRPSQWANPYVFLPYINSEAYDLFESYLIDRADLREWLYPLRGAEMICDCNSGELLPWTIAY